jgi:hypothetical protein
MGFFAGDDARVPALGARWKSATTIAARCAIDVSPDFPNAKSRQAA